jgi:hypothetical protein
MESNGFPMCVHVSGATKELLHDVAAWVQYGVRDIKGGCGDVAGKGGSSRACETSGGGVVQVGDSCRDAGGGDSGA